MVDDDDGDDMLPEQYAALKRAQGYQVDRSRPPGERWITLGNALTRAAHCLTLSEKRVLMLAISKIDSRASPPADRIYRTKITAAEYTEVFSVDPTTAYEALARAGRSLYQRSIRFHIPAHRRKGAPIEPGIITMRWVGKAHYQRGEGWIELSWWPDLLPELMGLRKKFTSYQLSQASALRSAYSWKLLELLMRYESRGAAEYTIEDFAEAMEATPKQRANFAAIRRKIVEPAVKELAEKDGWRIEWETVQAGKRVKALRFRFERDPQGRLDL